MLDRVSARSRDPQVDLVLRGGHFLFRYSLCMLRGFVYGIVIGTSIFVLGLAYFAIWLAIAGA